MMLCRSTIQSFRSWMRFAMPQTLLHLPSFDVCAGDRWHIFLNRYSMTWLKDFGFWTKRSQECNCLPKQNRIANGFTTLFGWGRPESTESWATLTLEGPSLLKTFTTPINGSLS